MLARDVQYTYTNIFFFPASLPPSVSIFSPLSSFPGATPLLAPRALVLEVFGDVSLDEASEATVDVEVLAYNISDWLHPRCVCGFRSYTEHSSPFIVGINPLSPPSPLPPFFFLCLSL